MAMLGLKKVIEQSKLKKRHKKVKKKKERTEFESYEDDAFILTYQLDNNEKEIARLLADVEKLEDVHNDYKEKKDREYEELMHTVKVLLHQWQDYELECEDAEAKVQLQVEAAYTKAAAAVALAQKSLEVLQEKVADVVSLVEEKEKVLAQHQHYISKGRQKLQDKIDHLTRENDRIIEDFEADKAFIKTSMEQCQQTFARMTEEDIERIKEEILDMGIQNLSPENWKVLAERRRLLYEVWLQADEVVSLTQEMQIIVCDNSRTTKELKALEQKLWKMVPLPTWPNRMNGLALDHGPVLAFTTKTLATEDLFSFEQQFRVPQSLETVLRDYPVSAMAVDPVDKLNRLSITAVKGSYKKSETDWPVTKNMVISAAHWPRIIRRRSSLHIQELALHRPIEVKLFVEQEKNLQTPCNSAFQQGNEYSKY